MASSLSPVGASLGLGTSLLGNDSTSLADQVSSESEDERRRRLKAMQAGKLLPGSGNVSAGYSAALSPAGTSLGLGGF